MRYFFRVEYDGSDFGGWQRQPNAVSIQEVLENAIQIAVRTPVSVTGAGRTDAGVHARGQGVHFDIDQKLDLRKCELSINALLPKTVGIYDLQLVDDAFHARFSAINRRYKYYMCTRKSPLNFQRAWMLYYRIDWEKIRTNIEYLKGVHDFTSFCASGSGTDNNVCNVKHSSLTFENGFIVFAIEADRFIYKMVRTVVGTLIEIGRGKIKTSLKEIIDGRHRGLAGETAPPFGLVLEHVEYPGAI